MTLLAVTLTATARDYTRLVNPFIGTTGGGNTYPGAQVPFGMVQLSPDGGLPGWDRIAGYYYPDTTIAGFSHTHLSGTGAGDLYDISFMPVTLPTREAEAPLGIHSRFRHDTEMAIAGYYKVTLEDYGIDVELTAMPRTGIQRYTFPADGRPRRVILNLAKATNWDATQATYYEVVDSVTLRGYRYSDGWARGQQVYFATRFSQPFRIAATRSTLTATGGTAHVLTLDFDAMKGDTLMVCTALSGVSLYGATQNLQAEAPIDNFEAYVAVARKMWNKALGTIEVESDDRDALTTFYTALYHALLAPTIASDIDGRYRGADRRIHQSDGVHYSTFSLWDTYRAAHPLLTIVQPQRVADMVNSLLDFEEQSGALPVWSLWGSETNMMIGYHAVPVIVDAVIKGFPIDPNAALEACVRSADRDDYRSIGRYKRLGYVPAGVTDMGENDWSLSRTMEYAYDDWCVGLLADALAYDSLIQAFGTRADYYRNLWQAKSGFFVPRDSTGQFVPNFDPEAYSPHICESNAYQYLWSVQHDISGLATLMGGKRKMRERLDDFFTHATTDTAALPIFSTGMIGQYAHGNEPSHHVAYLYNYVKAPEKTQRLVHDICHTLYRNAPDGLCGNDDCGQLSAWYVLSAMGFYPVNPTGGLFDIGTPRFPKVTLHTPAGTTFTIVAEGYADDSPYVRSVQWDGRRYNKHTFSYDMLLQGGILTFIMSDTPCRAWY